MLHCRTGLKEQLTKKVLFSHYVLNSLPMESRVESYSSLKISQACSIRRNHLIDEDLFGRKKKNKHKIAPYSSSSVIQISRNIEITN